MKQYNILICGVGGQGVIYLGTLLKEAAVLQGLGVLGSESIGVSQREGPVASTVRYIIAPEKEGQDERRNIYSGAIPWGCADLVIATEPSEALRNAPYLSPESVIILNTFTIPPKGYPYPPLQEMIDRLREITPRVYPINANEISLDRFGSYRMANTILLGMALACADPLVSRETIESFFKDDREKEALAIGIAQGAEVRLRGRAS